MRESLLQETLHSRSVTIAKHDNVYTCGDNDELVYFIESGQIKLLMLSPEGRECLLAIHCGGIFSASLSFRIRRAFGNRDCDERDDR